MTAEPIAISGGRIFDGEALLEQHTALFSDGELVDIVHNTSERITSAPFDKANTRAINLDGDLLSVGFADLQVNGGGGLLFNDAPTTTTLRTISSAHNTLGTRLLLPTLISDTPQVTSAAIDAAIQAGRQKIPGIAGLHLEGPHLSVPRKGAHAETMIRPMQQHDMEALIRAAEQLPVLKVTIAPENVTLEQTRQLTAAGILVALGHTNASYDTCINYQQAGASSITHLFNAMSPLASREPGVVGAALHNGYFNCGLIADAVHVHPSTMALAWSAKQGPGRFYLVSDAMAPAGTDIKSFKLNERTIYRNNNSLRLSDGTLAGADLDLTKAIRILHTQAGIDLQYALKAAITTPRELLSGTGWKVTPGTGLDEFIRIEKELTKVHGIIGN